MSTADFVQLGLPMGASDDDVRKAYKKMALRWHPDKAHIHGVSVQVATEKFKEIGNAYLHLQAGSVGSKAASGRTAAPSTSKASPSTSKAPPSTRKAPPSTSKAPPSTSKAQKSHDPPPAADDYSDSEEFSEHFGFFFDDFFFDDFFFEFSYKFFGGDYAGDENDFHTFDEHWKGNYMKRRGENVKKMYDRRDRKLSKTSKEQGRICDTCKERNAISETQALNSGVDWNEYKAQCRKTCWACKNAHKSVLTASMAKQQMSVLKKHPEVFDALQKQKKYFHHQPVNDHVGYTRCSMYFWRADLVEQATNLGWKSRAGAQNEKTKAAKVPKSAAKKPEPKAKAAEKNTKKTTAKKPKACSATTPGVTKRTRNTTISVTVKGGKEEAHDSIANLIPGGIASSDGVPHTPPPRSPYLPQDISGRSSASLCGATSSGGVSGSPYLPLNVSGRSSAFLYGATRYGGVPGSPYLPLDVSGRSSASLCGATSSGGVPGSPYLPQNVSGRSSASLDGATRSGGVPSISYPPFHHASARASLGRHVAPDNK